MVWYNTPMTKKNLTTLLGAVTPVTARDLDVLLAKAEFNRFLHQNEMVPIGGDCYEDAGGAVWHESNIEDEIKHQKKAK